MNERILAIRYIIYKVAQDFLLINSKKTDDKVFFDQNNNFSLAKCLLLPFVVTIANGKKEQLMEGVFKNSFFPDVKNKVNGVMIGSIIDQNFVLLNSNDLNLEFEKSKLIFNFDNNEFISLSIQIKEAIDYSIRFLKERRIEEFSSLNSISLRKLSMNNDAFEFLLEEIETRKFEMLNDVAIVNQFQKHIISFPFYLSLVDQLEKDIV